MKIYWEALKKLPTRFIHDETIATMFGDDRVIIANPNFAPMVYTAQMRRWVTIKAHFKPDEILLPGEIRYLEKAPKLFTRGGI